MKFFVLSIIFFFTQIAFGQKTNIDSLVNVTKTMQEDSVKTQVFFDIAKAYKLEKVDFLNATKFAQKSIDLSNKIQYYSGTVSAMLLIGQTY